MPPPSICAVICRVRLPNIVRSPCSCRKHSALLPLFSCQSRRRRVIIMPQMLVFPFSNLHFISVSFRGSAAYVTGRRFCVPGVNIVISVFNFVIWRKNRRLSRIKSENPFLFPAPRRVPPRTAKYISIVFSGDMCLGKYTYQPANVRPQGVRCRGLQFPACHNPAKRL